MPLIFQGQAMTQQFDVIIIGAGAAGLMCAATAGYRGRSVLVIDNAKKAGRKILISGGGRCNFTNQSVSPDNFLCGNPHFVKSALARYPSSNFIELVERHGIEYHERDHGQATVLDLLELHLLVLRAHAHRVEREGFVHTARTGGQPTLNALVLEVPHHRKLHREERLRRESVILGAGFPPSRFDARDFGTDNTRNSHHRPSSVHQFRLLVVF